MSVEIWPSRRAMSMSSLVHIDVVASSRGVDHVKHGQSSVHDMSCQSDEHWLQAREFSKHHFDQHNKFKTRLLVVTRSDGNPLLSDTDWAQCTIDGFRGDEPACSIQS